MIVKNKGRQYHDSEVVNIPKQTITHNKSNKSNRNKKIDGIEKNDDDLIEINNIDLQPEKIIHQKQNKKSRNKNPDNSELGTWNCWVRVKSWMSILKVLSSNPACFALPSFLN